MNSLFDEYIDRTNTGSVKYNFLAKDSKLYDVIPMWIADMDFKVPHQITEALRSSVQHGVFGYCDSTIEYDIALQAWYKNNFNWDVSADWNTKVSGVMFAIASAIRMLTSEGNGVLIQQPVYYPFSDIIKANGRKLIVNELQLTNGRYEIDFEDFEKCIKNNDVKLFILCSPHNPVGRVWREDELRRIGEICEKYDVYIVVDEIHSDFVYAGNVHTVFTKACPAMADKTIICTSPTKTFNLAGLQVANIFIQDKKLRDRFREENSRTGFSMLNAMGIVATQAAYQYGQQWRDGLVAYLEQNVKYIEKKLNALDCGIKLIRPEGTYLLWLDCRELQLSDRQLADFFANKAKLWLHTGRTFGLGGSGFMRMNVACPKSTIENAMKNIYSAVKGNC